MTNIISLKQTPPKISVIIPYYQKEEGILGRCLNSVYNQTYKYSLEIIIVDDESPIDANEEVCQSQNDAKIPLKIIRQKNAGPAGARNKGLDSITHDTCYVAFLDSDDEWTPDHIENAVAALEAGYDFYFSDIYQLGQDISAFNRAKRINIDEHPHILLGCSFLHHYTGDMAEQIIVGNIIGTPSVVYRYQANPTLRFREDLIKAGEDYLFWLSFCQENNKIAFSSKPEVICGKGVNIYSGTQYGTPESLELMFYETKYRKIILQEFNTSEYSKKYLTNKIKTIEETFLSSLFHIIKSSGKLNLTILLKYFSLHPQFLLNIPLNLLNYLKRKILL
ncbi:MAG: hypothetical protein CTY19_03215 [Methylomonas sp.]|nr:MAG: hypothetical protein CTY19_03215 [Methylomonas sp.]